MINAVHLDRSSCAEKGIVNWLQIASKDQLAYAFYVFIWFLNRVLSTFPRTWGCVGGYRIQPRGMWMLIHMGGLIRFHQSNHLYVFNYDANKIKIKNKKMKKGVISMNREVLILPNFGYYFRRVYFFSWLLLQKVLPRKHQHNLHRPFKGIGSQSRYPDIPPGMRPCCMMR